ncbi:MAG TPA: PAS domain S-box protein, partial [Holophaga sp.]|nr:PAS domain S-box protein [Holophaga sp.]
RPGAAPQVPQGWSQELQEAPLGVFLVKDAVLVRINAQAGRIAGVDPDMMAGAHSRTFFLDDAAFEDFAARAGAMLRGGHPFREDIRLRRVDGSTFWAHVTCAPVVQDSPEKGQLWYMEDVTARVEAQLDLAEVLSLNQTLISSSPIGILLFSAADGACVLVNPAACRMVNAPEETILRQNFRRLPSWKEAGLLELADKALKTGEEQRTEGFFKTLSGRSFWGAAQLIPFVSRGERLLLCLVEDATERHAAGEALRASEEKHRVVVEALTEGLALVDLTGRFTFVNSRLAEMTGYAMADLAGRHYGEFILDADRTFLLEKAYLQRRVEGDSFELGLRRADGSLLETRVSLASVVDPQGIPTALAVLVTDISVGKRAQRDRERLVAEMEQKNRELETLLYVASHDLRSPLVNIQGFSQRLARSLDALTRLQAEAADLEAFRAEAAPHLQERMPGSLEFIRASGAKMDAIINGLLTLSRAGRMVLRAEPLDMNALVRNCAASLAFQIQSANGSLETGDLPPCVADPVQVAQILSNLLDNAVKYRDGERPLRITVTGEVLPDACAYVVEDNGIGIPPEHRERVWEIFQRLDPQGPVAGDGLGLTLVRRMAERNGGRILLETWQGPGCRFRLELPRPAAEARP